MTRTLLLAAAGLGLVAAGASAPRVMAAASWAPPGTSALTRTISEAVARGDVPGLVVAVVTREGIVYHEAAGRQNVARNVALAKDAIFNIASMTKPITSIATMMLVEEKKLALDDPVARHLPAYADRQVLVRVRADGTFETRPAKRPITIRHLLTHTSGLGYGFSSPTVTAMQKGTMRPETELPLLFDPGEGWAYGASTRVLGELVARVSGEPLDAFLARRILRPLGMQDTGYAVEASSMGRVVSSHTRAGEGFTERQPGAAASSAVAGDGGLYSTAGDYARFLQMLLNDGRAGSTRLLQADTVRTIFRSHTGRVAVQRQETTNRGLSLPFPDGAGRDTWGLGFQLSNPSTKQPFMRSPGSGTWAGIFNTHFWIDREKEVGVIAMMQLLPFYDEKAMALLAAIEEQVYRHLK